MNERMRALAEKSGLKVESWMTNPPKPFQILGSVEDFEKFTNAIYNDIITVVAAQSLMGESAMDVFINLKRIYEGIEPEPVARAPSTDSYDF